MTNNIKYPISKIKNREISVLVWNFVLGTLVFNWSLVPSLVIAMPDSGRSNLAGSGQGL
jgi:hypothetical protein